MLSVRSSICLIKISEKGAPSSQVRPVATCKLQVRSFLANSGRLRSAIVERLKSARSGSCKRLESRVSRKPRSRSVSSLCVLSMPPLLGMRKIERVRRFSLARSPLNCDGQTTRELMVSGGGTVSHSRLGRTRKQSTIASIAGVNFASPKASLVAGANYTAAIPMAKHLLEFYSIGEKTSKARAIRLMFCSVAVE